MRWRWPSDLGDRLAHVHMADGTGVTNRDEHLVPGRGRQPCARLLEGLAADGYPGTVVLEVNTRRAISREARAGRPCRVPGVHP